MCASMPKVLFSKFSKACNFAFRAGTGMLPCWNRKKGRSTCSLHAPCLGWTRLTAQERPAHARRSLSAGATRNGGQSTPESIAQAFAFGFHVILVAGWLAIGCRPGRHPLVELR
jgi:hypothetical protein